jgi:ABC-type antimicrobial peptide transport system permease subunit
MIPLRYNTRNLMVRWRTTALTAIGFTLVVALLVVMLAFVEGLKELAANAGHSGNVIILRDGANDELFSELNVEDVHTSLQGLFSVNEQLARLDDDRPLVSFEVYSIATQELPPKTPGGRPSYRFLQIRGIEEPEISGAVHELKLLPGSRWFNRSGTECVMGAGIARTLGLNLGDTFQPRPGLPPVWTVVGILDSAGSPFDSEIWSKREEVGKYFGKDNEERKQSFFTSIVVRTPNYETAKLAAAAFRNFSEIKLNALPERDYYDKLTESIQTFQFSAIFIAIVMAVGGMFGLMNTMFAAVSQRIKDIGVLRIIGYRRRQILYSFLLESLLIAVLGGTLGLILGSAVDGLEQTGQLSSGQGGGKTVVFKMVVDEKVLRLAVAFTLAMGFLGGLLPALSAMRLKPLDAVR